MRIDMARHSTRLAGTMMASAVAFVSVSTGVVHAEADVLAAPSAHAPIAECPALYALGIQGTGESSPDAAPSTDTGMLSTVFRPLLALAAEPGLVDRAYVPYEAAFGGAVPGGVVPYAESVAGGLERLRAMATQVVERCPDSRIAVVGYSQGAHVASLFAQDVGSGRSAVPADKVAAVALFADPIRGANAPLFPGAPGRTAPLAAPGTSGDTLADVAAVRQAAAPGGGLGVQSVEPADFGRLTGRVASFCATGDLACDAPQGAPLLRAVANLVSQVKLSGGDPIGSLISIADAMAYTSIKTATTVVNEDIAGSTLADVSLAPGKSIAERVADAADPRVAPDGNAALRALLKVGMIGLNAVTTVVKTVLGPDSITELAAATLSNPLAGLTLLSTRLTGAIPELVPPTTGVRLVNEAFTAVTESITDNRELLDVSTWVRYWNTTQRHDAYSRIGVGADGATPTRYVAEWFAAVARDAAAISAPGAEPVGGSDQHGAGIFTSPTGASATPEPSGGGQFPFGTGADGASSGGATTPPAALPGTTTPTTRPFAVN
ncbi:cutinase family protein [Nocardia rhizosphaerae]|uniref:Cutinase family protein n=1 Tax=Nocardia rhizosphaerae TaxID=1691571 RepID=A0ABV8L8L3_9NOCA